MDEDLRNRFTTKEIDVFVIKELVAADEVRDLFIRLQSGTALSRQQVRDAWPGTIGPLIERLAGKLNRTPAVTLFKQIDKRGTRNDEEGSTRKRLFDNDQKRQIYRNVDGKCGVCGLAVDATDAEYDHFPTWHRVADKPT